MNSKNKICAGGGERDVTITTPPSPFSVKLSSIKFVSVSRVCVWCCEKLCVDESQWEIVLITTPNDGSVIVIVALMHLLTSDNGQVIG